jgi:predicted MPP superfamily phosphohydrolase
MYAFAINSWNHFLPLYGKPDGFREVYCNFAQNKAEMRSRRFLAIVLIIAVLIDVYVFQAIKTITQSLPPRPRTAIFVAYWGLSVLALSTFLLLPYLYVQYTRAGTYITTIILGFYIAKLLALVFLLIDDIRRGIQWIILRATATPATGSGPAISRSTFLSWLGIGLGTSLFGALVYGFGNKYKYRVHRVSLAFDNLPASFKGLKIVQLSDIHCGSFDSPDAVSKGVDLVLAEKPDLILFTGDLVNDRATEMKNYQTIFSRLQAPMGIYSTLGNHDYGDYGWWESPELKKANLDRLKEIQQEMGWRLLVNEHVVLEKDGGQIALIGIENWSAKARFPKYGRMDLAYAGTEKYPFKILMSHDPSHWDAEVRPHYPDIDLMLAGHTHGMQFGVEIPGLKWSPVQFLYKQWAGLYEEGRQRLYVNRGYGFIGYPGRFGILPEITVIELC